MVKIDVGVAGMSELLAPARIASWPKQGEEMPASNTGPKHSLLGQKPPGGKTWVSDIYNLGPQRISIAALGGQ